MRYSSSKKHFPSYFLIILLSISLITGCSDSGASSSPPNNNDDGPPPVVQPPEYYILVSSRDTNSIKRYRGDTGVYVNDFVAPNSGGLDRPQEVLYADDGNLLVTGRGNQSVKKYNGKTGAYIGDFTTGFTLDNPTKTTFGPGNTLYVSQWGTAGESKVVKFDATTGEFLGEGAKLDMFQEMGHSWDDGDNLYVVNFGDQDVHKFDPAGNDLGQFVGSEFLGGPVNLWFDDAGDLLIVDWATGSVKKFNGETGVFISIYISGMGRAEGVALGPDGFLYVCDWLNGEVNRYNADTGSLNRKFITTGNLGSPNSILFRQSSLFK